MTSDGKKGKKKIERRRHPASHNITEKATTAKRERTRGAKKKKGK